MLIAAILCISLGAAAPDDYLRPLGEKALDQAALDAEGFGDKKSLAREADGLKVTIKPGEAEAGYKTTQALKIGGDCTITANFVIRKLPKPAQDDGAAIGIALATQSLDQPEGTLLREVETDGKEVFRAVEKSNPGGGQMGDQPMMMMFNRFGNQGQAKPPKPPRRTFPAKGQTVRLELKRQGPTLRYQVFDDLSTQPREVGQLAIGPGDIAGVKLFASNRNGVEPLEVLFRDLTIRADRLTGLGTAVRSIDGTVVHGEPTGLDAGHLVVGGTPPAAEPAADPTAPATLPAEVFARRPAAAPAAVAPAAVAPAPAAAAPPPVLAPARVPGAVAVAPPARVVPGPAATAPKADATPPSATPKPKARIPLAEVESIAFERAATLAGRFLGQPNVDNTGPGGEPPKDAKEAKKPEGDDLSAPPPGTVAPPKVAKAEPKPNGIRDLHLSLSGLREAAIQQITIQCPTDKGQGSWRLDTSSSTDGPISVLRAGNESWADLFIEPPAGDCYGKDFMVAITYADGQNGNAQVKATSHTDPKHPYEPSTPTPALDARVYLAGEEQLFGKLESLGEQTLGLTTPWGDRLDVPMARVLGVYMGMADHKESPESFAKRLKARGVDDLLLARSKDGEVVAIAGVVEGVKDNKLTFNYQGRARALPMKQVEGLILAARPGPAPPSEVRPTFSMAGGIALSGRWTAIEAATWRVETPWGQVVKLPAAEVCGVRVRGGRMAYLSDLEPSKVEEVPYFGRRSPYRKDVNLDGDPLRLDGQVVAKGLAVHSRSSLTYDLDRRYATFEALVGFDDSALKKGRVACRVLADGKEIYANPDLRADAPPVRLSLPVAGADQLRLVVDFGPDEDTGDRVIWGNARLFRSPPAPTTASRP